MNKDIHSKWQKYPVFVRYVVTALDNTMIIFKEELFKLGKMIQRKNKSMVWRQDWKHTKNFRR